MPAGCPQFLIEVGPNLGTFLSVLGAVLAGSFGVRAVADRVLPKPNGGK